MLATYWDFSEFYEEILRNEERLLISYKEMKWSSYSMIKREIKYVKLWEVNNCLCVDVLQHSCGIYEVIMNIKIYYNLI